MANVILTPKSLWKDFDDSLPLQSQIIKERQIGGVVYQEVKFYGRKTSEGRIQIYGVSARPEGNEQLPGLLILPDADDTIDMELLERFAKRGYFVLMIDYRGEWEGNYTMYPSCISYANTRQAGRHRYYVDETARETSRYEWVALARYAVRYLREVALVSKVGVMGLREGGEIVWQLMTFGKIDCGVPVCAAGWKAYKGIHKFANEELIMDEERWRYIAGVDSQSYAPFVECPVLMLCSSCDHDFDCDRAYDTFCRINEKQEKAIYYSMDNNGFIDKLGLEDLDLFMDRFLKEREVFIPSTVEISIEENEKNELEILLSPDSAGVLQSSSAFLAEEVEDSAHRQWKKCDGVSLILTNKVAYQISFYKGSKVLFASGNATYSSGFTVSSKIAIKRIEKNYQNATEKNRVFFTGEDKYCFLSMGVKKNSIGGCFLETPICPEFKEGYGEIIGVTSACGLKTYRLAQSEYAPQPNQSLVLDVYTKQGCELCIRAVFKVDDEEEYYFYKKKISPCNCWQKIVAESNEFKDALGAPLLDFKKGISITFQAEDKGDFLINNILWI